MADILSKKANQNQITATWAHDQGFYGVAISRKYYYVFLSVRNFMLSLKNNPYNLEELSDIKNGNNQFKGAHGPTIRHFDVEAHKSKAIPPWKIDQTINDFVSFRELRNIAEYDPVEINMKHWGSCTNFAAKIMEMINDLDKELNVDEY